jgi:hypothetical protein
VAIKAGVPVIPVFTQNIKQVIPSIPEQIVKIVLKIVHKPIINQQIKNL